MDKLVHFHGTGVNMFTHCINCGSTLTYCECNDNIYTLDNNGYPIEIVDRSDRENVLMCNECGTLYDNYLVCVEDNKEKYIRYNSLYNRILYEGNPFTSI